jgi:membrane protease YdiL (CAAX protease family)
MRRDPLRVALQVGVYGILCWFVMGLAGWLLGSLGPLAGTTLSVLAAALSVNWLALRIYHGLGVGDAGLHWTSTSARHLGLGVLGGVGAACLVLVPPLVVGAARIAATPGEEYGSAAFVTLILAVGAVGEELLFRGYGFQLLLGSLGAWATIVPVSVLFAAAHAGNPSSNWMGLANTAGFGIAFGYALFRSRDLWLPIGLHFGWNFALPLFGTNVSGLRIKVTGYSMRWSAGALWSGGEYGPEASILASLALVVLGVCLWKAPLRPQPSALLDPPVEDAPCASPPPS